MFPANSSVFHQSGSPDTLSPSLYLFFNFIELPDTSPSHFNIDSKISEIKECLAFVISLKLNANFSLCNTAEYNMCVFYVEFDFCADVLNFDFCALTFLAFCVNRCNLIYPHYLSKNKLKVQPFIMGKNKSYNTDILVSLIDEHLPDGGEQLERRILLNYIKSRQVKREDIKRHWVNTLCNKQNKPTGSSGGKPDLILKCQRIQKRILEKSNSRMYGASDIEDLSDDEDDDNEMIISGSSSSNNPSSQSDNFGEKKSSTSDEKLKSTSKTLFKSENRRLKIAPLKI